MATFGYGGAPQNANRQYDLIRVGAGKCVTFTCRTATWVDVITHFNGRTTLVCTGDDQCEACRRGSQQVWKAYLLGQSMTSDRVCIVELTANAAYCLIEDEMRGGTLLGAVISLSRRGSRPNGVLNAKILCREKNVVGLPLEQCEHTVRCIYRAHGPAWQKIADYVKP